MKNLLVLFFALALLSLNSCKQKPAPATSQDSKTSMVINDSLIDGRADAKLDNVNNEAINKIISKWAANINARNAEAMDSLYADTVMMFQGLLPKAKVLAYWKKFFAENSNYSTSISGQVYRIGNNSTIIVIFRSNILNNGKEDLNNYQMRFKRFAGSWKIIQEATIEDKSKKIKSQFNSIKLEDIKDCDMAAEAAVRNSLPFMSLISQPGAELKLEYKPGDKNGPFGKYQYSVFGYKPGTTQKVNLSTFQLEQATGILKQIRPNEQTPYNAPYLPKFKEYILSHCKK